MTDINFNIDRAADWLNRSVTTENPGGKCLHSVYEALHNTGCDALDPTGMNASDAIPVLDRDSRFARVATGFGDKIDPATKYQWHKGDIAVWSGGKHGHIEMCVGSTPDGSPIWKSDFKSQESNWSGLLDPASHGNFVIYRAKNVAAAETTNVTREETTDKTHTISTSSAKRPLLANSPSSDETTLSQRGLTTEIPYTTDSSLANLDPQTKLEVMVLFEFLSMLGLGQPDGASANTANLSSPQTRSPVKQI